MKEGMDDYVLDPVARQDRRIEVFASNYDAPFALNTDKTSYDHGDDIVIQYTPIENLYNEDDKRIGLDTPNTPAPEFDVNYEFPGDMEPGVWYVNADFTIVDAEQNDVSNRYYDSGRSVMFRFGKGITFNTRWLSLNKHSGTSSIAFSTVDLEVQQLQDDIDVAARRNGNPFEIDNDTCSIY